MRHLKLLVVACAAICALGVTVASSATAALPDLSMILGEEFPLHLDATIPSPGCVSLRPLRSSR